MRPSTESGAGQDASPKSCCHGSSARSRAITTSSKIHAWEAQLPAEFEALRGPGRGRSCEKASSWLHPQSCHCRAASRPSGQRTASRQLPWACSQPRASRGAPGKALGGARKQVRLGPGGHLEKPMVQRAQRAEDLAKLSGTCTVGKLFSQRVWRDRGNPEPMKKTSTLGKL